MTGKCPDVSQNILLTWLKNVPDVSLNIFLALRHVTTSRQKIFSFVATNTTWNCPKVLSKIYSFVGTNTAPKKSWYLLKNCCFWGVSTNTAAKCPDFVSYISYIVAANLARKCPDILLRISTSFKLINVETLSWTVISGFAVITPYPPMKQTNSNISIA